MNFLILKLVLEKAEEPEIKLPTFARYHPAIAQYYGSAVRKKMSVFLVDTWNHMFGVEGA